MSKIKVAVNGALGRMGQQVVGAVAADTELELTCAADIKADRDHLSVAGLSRKVPLHTNLTALIEMYHPQVVVDFTVPGAAMGAARLALKNGANLVMGTTGLSEADLKEIDRLAQAHKKGAVVAANFAIGAVMMMHLARIASKYFDNAEIIELHHDRKLDAPSGTALATARAMVSARGKPFVSPLTEKETLKGTRGGQSDGISIHSIRLPGLVASQEVIFGALGQTLSIRHDTISRESFMPGVILAIKEVTKRHGLVCGLDVLLNLGD
ncbi:MAG: 4-hydroxy-tetrahydrodipicolinate reductase [Chloroflexi bacterium]|jgi:4-hydroxy-tetrahydrodipicolinate reductase|nr:4-hydroxy-tetrahydrodipicolinate reductase [Chloroflexota bacterium]